MNKLPKKFPEFSLLYKQLTKKIVELENKLRTTKDEKLKNEINLKMETYQQEIEKIKSMFPNQFFESINLQIFVIYEKKCYLLF